MLKQVLSCFSIPEIPINSVILKKLPLYYATYNKYNKIKRISTLSLSIGKCIRYALNDLH